MSSRVMTHGTVCLVVRDDRDPGVKRLLKSVERRGLPVHVIDEPQRMLARRVEDFEESGAVRGLPD